jgi:hypothetical protein
MAVLVPADFKAYAFALRSDSDARAEIVAAGLSKSQLQAAMQAIEDEWEDNEAALKTAVDTAAGVTLTNLLAKKLGKVWMQNKWGGL